MNKSLPGPKLEAKRASNRPNSANNRGSLINQERQKRKQRALKAAK